MPLEENLTLDSEGYADWILPGEWTRFTFAAKINGTYYITLPESKKDAVCAVVYLPDGSTMDADRRSVELKAGQMIHILCMTDWLERETTIPSGFSVCVSMDVVSKYYSENGYEYYIDSMGWADLLALPKDMVGIYLPEYVKDKQDGVEVYIMGSTNFDVVRSITEDLVIYCETGGKMEGWCQTLNACYVLYKEECTVAGDLTGDGLVTKNDAILLKHWLNESAGVYLTDSAYKMADLDGDGNVTAMDLVLLQKMLPTVSEK